jgi:RNA polymerase sigma factor (sigma-70 family)
MDYSGLVAAIDKENQVEINRLSRSLTLQLISYLRIEMNAAQEDAEDCAQQAFLISLELIQEDKLEQPDRIFSFLISTCRNKYINMMNRRKHKTHEDFSGDHCQQPEQLLTLLSDERRMLLAQCIEQLSEGYRTYIEYWFKHPGSGAKAAAKHFGISQNNAWTRKHRVISKLNECYQKKIKI